jgi:hypothetical protein
VSYTDNAYSNAVSYINSSIGTSNAAIVANASAAYSNAVSYTDNAYSNAVSYINSSIGTSNAAIVANASAAYSNAVTYTDTKIGTANLAIADAYSNSVSYTDSKIATANLAIANAYSNAISYADSKIATANSAITSNASAAYSNAVSYTDSKIATANLAIAAAYSNSVSYTDSKITTANSAITANASAAYSNSVSYTDSKIAIANSAITANASAAYSNATTYSSNASNISSGTVAEARLPYRMNQNVRDTDTVTFNGMTLTGNLVVSGNVNIIGANNLSLVDNMIYLNANSTVSNPDLGIAGNYNSGGYAHTGIFRDATDGIWKVYDNYGPEPDASPYIDTSNTTFHLANFQANNYFAGNTTSNWFVANNSGAYAPRFYDINNLSYYLDPDGTSVLSGLSVSSTITGSISGNAGTATSSPLLSALAAYAWSSSSIPSSYNLGIQSSFVSASEGFQSYGSVMTMKTYSAGGGAFQMYVPYGSGYGGTSLQVRFGDYSANTSAPPWTSWKTLLDSANYSSYALPLSGGTMTGTLNALGLTVGYGQTSSTITMYDSDNGNRYIHANSDRLGFLNLDASGWWAWNDNAGNWFSASSSRAPIFYDSDNTAYYIDPNNTSSVLGITLNGKINFPSGSGGGTTFSANHYSMGEDIADGGWSHPHYSDLIIGYHTGIRIGASYSGVRFYSNSPTTDANNDGNGDGGETLIMTVGGHAGGGSYVIAHASMRSPIFYDYDNTGYYVDPNNGGFSLVGGTSNRVTFLTNDSGIFVGNAEGNGVNHIRLGAAWGRPGVYSPTYLSLMAGNSQYIEFVTNNAQRGYIDTSSNMFAFGSMRSPIFYDSNDTAYYIDPTSVSNIIRLKVDTVASSWIGGFMGNAGITSTTSPTTSSYHAWYSNRTPLGGFSIGTLNNDFYFKWAVNADIDAGNNVTTSPLLISSAGNIYAGADMRAPIFYDSDNTGYYANPNGTSNFNAVTLNSVNGLGIHTGRNNEANKLVRTDGNGYIQAGWINTDSGDSGVANRLTRIYSSYDNYMRYSTLTDFKVHIGESAKNNYSRRIDYTGDSNYWVGSFGHGGYGANETFHGGSGFFDIWSGSNYPSGTSHIHGFNALHYTTNSLGSTGGTAYGIQVAGQYNQGGIIFARGCSGGSFSSWYRILSEDIWHNDKHFGSDGLIYCNQSRPNITYDRQDTGYYVDPNSSSYVYALTAAAYVRTNGYFYADANYGYGLVGAYASTRYQLVYAMGASYLLPADGTTTGNLYGLAWSHPNAGGAAGNLDSHGLLCLINGGFASAMSYTIKASSNIIAYSDERLKTNWRDLPDNFVEKLAGVKNGIYDRIDREITQVGVSAQSLQKLLPNAVDVADDEMKTLSVAYGNAALASAVELAKELVIIRKLVKEQQEKIDRLEKTLNNLTKV